MCHHHFSQRGFSSISFTGIDIAPLAPRMEDDDMNWRFVQHDLRRVPLPFRDDEFNLIMIKDLSMVTPTTGMQQQLMDEYLRILKPGGTLEIWDGDHSLRMLLPHAPPSTRVGDDGSEDEEQVHTNAMGTYTLTPQTPLAAPQNQFLMDYNVWITKALEARKLTAMPCTMMRPMLLQEAEDLVEIDNRRLAIPLGEVRWEREGVGGAVTQGTNGVSSHGISSKGKAKESDRKLLTAGQAALRRTALMTVVQMIESLEPLLREASGKGQDEWDRWHGNMMNDLLKSNGTSWGECLEVGAWWARKKPTT
jgi:SAM-dependent methyltransferase